MALLETPVSQATRHLQELAALDSCIQTSRAAQVKRLLERRKGVLDALLRLPQDVFAQEPVRGLIVELQVRQVSLQAHLAASKAQLAERLVRNRKKKTALTHYAPPTQERHSAYLDMRR